MASVKHVVSALALSSLASPCTSTWPSIGGDTYHSSTVYASLPSPGTGFAISKVLPPLLPPEGVLGGPLVAVDGSVIVPDALCRIRFTDADFNLVATWNGCPPNARVLSSPPALTSYGDIVIVVTPLGGVYGVSAVGDNVGATLWGPVMVSNGSAPLTPVVIGYDAWIASVDGFITLLDSNSGQVVHRSEQLTCSDLPDGIPASPAQLPDSSQPAVLAVVTSQGCMVTLAKPGVVVWSMPAAVNASFTAPITAPVAVSEANEQAYFVSSDGVFCCVSTLRPTSCTKWNGPCVKLPDNAGFGGGMAVSPSIPAFQNGQIFLIDSSGTEYAVFADDGAIAMSSPAELLIDEVLTTPVLVPDGLGQDLNVLIIPGVTGTVYAAYVGDAPTSADDSDDSTDDGFGNSGLAWSVNALYNISEPRGVLRLCTYFATCRETRAQHAATLRSPTFEATAFVVRSSDGAIIIGATDGSVVAIRPAHAMALPASDEMIAIVITACGVAIMLGIALVMYCAWRRRQTLRQMRRDDAAGMSAALLGTAAQAQVTVDARETPSKRVGASMTHAGPTVQFSGSIQHNDYVPRELDHLRSSHGRGMMQSQSRNRPPMQARGMSSYMEVERNPPQYDDSQMIVVAAHPLNAAIAPAP